VTVSPETRSAIAGAAVRYRLPGLSWILGLVGVFAALSIWILLSHLLATGGGVINRLPGPALVAQKLLVYAKGDLALDLMSSLKVFVVGWLAAVICATVVGIILGRVRILGAMFLPLVEAIRPVSSIAWVPLSIVWFGFGLMSKVFLVGLAVFLVVIVYAVDGSNRIPADLSRTAAMLGMSPWQRFRHLILPGTLAEVLIGMRVSLMTGWGTVIVAELVAADSGLGAHLISSQQSYDIPAVLATMICFGVAGFLMNAIFSVIELRLMPWRRKQLESAK
jgi:NitT/TauT family transport system permease protein